MSRTGDQYIKELHELRVRMWREAQEQGLSSREFIEKIHREGMEVWAELQRRASQNKIPQPDSTPG